MSEYRKLKKQGMTPDTMTDEINERAWILQNTAAQIVKAMEENIADLYSPEGFYIAFTAGWLPVPELWSDSSEFTHAKNWKTKRVNGGVCLTDPDLIEK